MAKASKGLSPNRMWKIAQVVHEAVRAWQAANGQDPAPAWGRAPKWMKVSTYEAVEWSQTNPNATASVRHKQWMDQKKADGWKFGKTKNATRKTHPLMVPYKDLPEVERRKDELVSGVIAALTSKMR